MASTTTPPPGAEPPGGSEGAAAAAAAAMVARADYPMYVVTAAADGETGGCLAGFVTQCSIVPARFVVCVSVENHTHGVAARARALGLHLLGEDQMDLAALFGEQTGDDEDKLARVAWHPGQLGAPVLEACAAWIEGEVLARVAFGDHTGHLVEPRSGGGGGHPGLLRYADARRLHPGHPPHEDG